MEISLFGRSYVGCISAAYLVINARNVLSVAPNGTGVDLINQGNCPVVVTNSSPEYTNVQHRLRTNQIVIDLARHWTDGDALAGERYYAIIN